MSETPDQPELLSVPITSLRQCGLDEVGRGALAGPLVAAAVIAPDDIAERLGPLSRFLRDSKTVPAARRREIAIVLRQCVVTYEIVTIPTEQINERGIGWANREAFRLLITLIAAREDVDEYVLDGKVRPPRPEGVAATIRCLPKADALVPAVSAASLLAKVYRDDLMRALAIQHPHYGWERNAGYGSTIHLTALREHGPCAEHRTLFVTTALSGGQKAKRAARRVLTPELL
ncbi:MAG TPA: ribonuclease HII [Ktedonobacterales bacterium]|jgi:ribonuclease HII|nr:ribonuclease HII [Ktedonobacterales bacterium]